MWLRVERGEGELQEVKIVCTGGKREESMVFRRNIKMAGVEGIG